MIVFRWSSFLPIDWPWGPPSLPYSGFWVFLLGVVWPGCVVDHPHLSSEGKAIPLQASTGPEGSRRLKLPDFKTVGT